MSALIYCFLFFLLSPSLGPSPVSASADITHNIPNLAQVSKYADCVFELTTQSAAKCYIPFINALSGATFNPKIPAHCCADWASLACVKKIGLTDAKCAEARGLIETQMKEKEESNVKTICDPFANKCDAAPKTELKSKYPECYEKVKNQLAYCTPKPMDLSQVSFNRTQCCAYWAMITCQRNVILNESSCSSAKGFANDEFNAKKEKPICNPYEFACPDAPDLEGRYPECFKALQRKQNQCAPTNQDFRNAAHDAGQCCAYWAMVECTRQQAIVEPVCKDVSGYIEVKFSSKNKNLTSQYCFPNKFDCNQIRDPKKILSDKYPECNKKIQAHIISCNAKFGLDFRGQTSIKIGDSKLCCTFWNLVDCIRQAVLSETVCSDLPIRSLIEAEYGPENLRLTKGVCDPKANDCDQSRACRSVIAEKRQICEARSSKDYSHAFSNQTQCCGFWAMIGCTRTLSTMESVCAPMRDWINAEYGVTNRRLAEQYCPADKFNCRKKKNGSGRVTENMAFLIALAAFGFFVQQFGFC